MDLSKLITSIFASLLVNKVLDETTNKPKVRHEIINGKVYEITETRKTRFWFLWW